MAQHKTPKCGLHFGACGIPAITYFRTGGHYHRPRELNHRVRNGNGCGLPSIVTGKEQARPCLARFSRSVKRQESGIPIGGFVSEDLFQLVDQRREIALNDVAKNGEVNGIVSMNEAISQSDDL